MTPAAIVVARRPLLGVDSFARYAGLHPDMVSRLVSLGLLEPVRDGAGELWFPVAQLARAARIQRLRAGFALNYAALGLVMDLLDRITELETALRQRPSTPGGGP